MIPAAQGDLLAAAGRPWMGQMVIQGVKMIHEAVKNGVPNPHLDMTISMATRVGTGGRDGALRHVWTERERKVKKFISSIMENSFELTFPEIAFYVDFEDEKKFQITGEELFEGFKNYLKKNEVLIF